MSEEHGRNQNAGSNYSGRKPSVHKYGDNKGKNYSPSASYNYQNSQGRGQGQGYQQHPRRRIDRYKRENMNFSDKLVKQNDIIIRLLKDIRDSLAGTIPTPVEAPEVNEQEKTSIPVEASKEEPAEIPVSTEDEKKPEPETTDPEVPEDKEAQPEASEPEEKTSDVADQ